MNVTYIKAKNYLSYKSLDINLKDKDSVFLIIGRNSEEVDESEGNGSGKTSFASVPLFALYGRCRGVFDKELLAEDVVYIDEDGKRASKCEIELGFEHGDFQYKVERSISEKGVQKLSLHVFNEISNEYEDLSLKAGTNKRTGKKENGIIRTQQRIDDILGCNAELFINSVYFEQSNIDSFARGSLNEKDELIKVAAGIYRWGDYALEISKDAKDHEDQLTKSMALIEEYGDIDEIDRSIDEFKELIKKSNEEKLEKITLRDKIKLELQTVSEQLLAIESKRKEREAIEKDLTITLNTLNEQRARITRTESAIQKSSSDIARMKHENERILNEVDDIKKQIQAYTPIGYTQEQAQVINAEIQELSNQISVIKSKIEDNINKGKSIQSMTCPLGLGCDKLTPDAKNRYRSSLIEEYKEYQNQLKELTSHYENKRTMNQAIVSDIQLQQNNEKRRNLIEQLENKLTSNYELIEAKNIECNSYRITVEETKRDATTSANRENDLREKLRTTQNVYSDELRGREIQIKTQLRTVEDEVNSHEKNSYEYNAHIKSLLETKTKVKGLKEKFNIFNDELKLIKYSLNAVRRDIPHNLIKNVIPELEEYTREFLYKLSSGRMDVEFKLHRELKSKGEGSNLTNSFDICATVDGKQLKYAQTSGGERARMDVAIHLAYVCFMANRSGGKLENIWLDEVGMALDEKGVEVFVDIVNELKTQYGFKKIFVITQNTKMKKMIDNVITVIRTAEGSKLIV